MEDFIMYDEIFSQITNAANKRNLRDSTIHAYCTSVAHFLKYTDKPIDALTTDDVDTFLTEKDFPGFHRKHTTTIIPVFVSFIKSIKDELG